MPSGIQSSARGLDLSPRIAQTTTVSASPSAATETIIATAVMPGDLSFAIGVIVIAFASITIGTSGANLRLRVRQTNVSGAVVADSGTTTGGIAATNVCDINCQGTDTSPGQAQTYVVTAQVGSAAATSTVGQVSLICLGA